MYAIAAYGVQSGVRCRAAGCASRKRDAAASLFLDTQPTALHLTPDNQQPSTANHRPVITHTYSLELLMMGIEVPETR